MKAALSQTPHMIYVSIYFDGRCGGPLGKSCGDLGIVLDTNGTFKLDTDRVTCADCRTRFESFLKTKSPSKPLPVQLDLPFTEAAPI